MLRSLLAGALSLHALWLAPQAAPRRAVAVEHVTLVEGASATPASDVTVITDGTRISAIGPSNRTTVPAGAETVDGRGRFLIPGLWDMHVHLTNTTELACPLFVANGVTGVRDMGGELELIDWMRDRISRGEIVGPTIHRAGPFVDGSKPGVPDRLVVSGTADGAAAARLLKSRGVDYIKTHTATPRDAYFALVSEARTLALPVVGHVPFSVTPEEAVDAGQHTLEHIVTLFEGPIAKLVRDTGMPQEQALVQFTDGHFAALADRMVAKHTWLDPTMIAYWTRAHQWDLGSDPRNRYVAASGKEFWKLFADLPDTPAMRALQARAYARFTAILGIVAKRGVRLLAGTDVAGRFLYAGFSVHDELARLVDAGLSPAEALRAATRNPAEALGVLGERGSIEVGKRADLVLLDADPLANIANTKRINAVIAGGRLLRRDALDGLLASAAAEAPNR
jgi:imidazolonepropionase-like amidohydrolase